MSSVKVKKPQTFAAGQYKVTATATAIGSGTLMNGIILKAKSTNAGDVFIGGSTVTTTADGTGNGYILESGSEIFIPLSSLGAIYAIGTVNDVLSWVGV